MWGGAQGGSNGNDQRHRRGCGVIAHICSTISKPTLEDLDEERVTLFITIKNPRIDQKNVVIQVSIDH